MSTQPAPLPTYKLDPSQWETNRLKIKRLNIAIVFGGVGVVAAFSALKQPGLWFQATPRLVATNVLVLGTICGIGWFFALGRIDKAAKRYATYELIVSPGGLLKRQFEMPDVWIQFTEIGYIRKIEGKGAMVSSKGQTLWIPDELVGYEEVLTSIRDSAPQFFETADLPLWLRPWPPLIISIITFPVILLSSNLRVVLIASVLYLLALATDWIKISRGLLGNKRQKRKAMIMTPIVLLIVFFRIWVIAHR